MSTSFVVSVALPVPLRRQFDYLPSQSTDLRKDYSPGTRVQVPFGRRSLTGVVLAISNESELPVSRLKPVAKILDRAPLIPPVILQLCQWVADYYHAPIGEVVLASLPPPLRTASTDAHIINSLQETYWSVSSLGLTAGNADHLIRGAKQKQLWSVLSQRKSMLQGDITAQGYSLTQLRALGEKGLVQSHSYIPGGNTATPQILAPPLLNREQQDALNTIVSKPDSFRTILLNGVTGSGKTEVYLAWIALALTQRPDSQFLALAPEISLTPQLRQRFASRFGDKVAAYHSALTDKERMRVWINVLEGRTQIVIGTRSAVFLPFNDLAGIIVDEEHDSSFKQQDGARYNARDLAILRAKEHSCPIVLGSATPSLESLMNARGRRYESILLRQRAVNANTPSIRLLDIKSRPLHGGISPPLLEEIKQHLAEQRQVMLFINRRGFSPTLMCVECGWLAECRNCDARLTYHMKAAQLRCHHCDSTYPLPTCCPKCKQDSIKAVGAGTERTEEFLEATFPDTPVIRIDRDTTQTKGSLQDKLHQIRSNESCIIVGTQMLAKGHDFPNLALVGIINADSGLFSSDFRAAEKTAQLLLQVAGRAGRSTVEGKVIIQTLFPSHPLLQAIAAQDYNAICEEELFIRESGRLPPFTSMALIRAEAPTLEAALGGLWTLKESLMELQQVNSGLQIEIHGPFPSVMQRKQNRFHAILWLFAPQKAELRQFLKHWLRYNEGIATPSNFRWLIDVDPLETL
ncbi:primosomal protein N' [Hahella aquimaris]|uniref:primosomal protein N' n=1 Tax=Hahella sp. HNIBRBA332 TaxID=3015983 RepID=UPI00273A8FE3|nr:primosomal protein N' [Hahella sp. HNIBRBA332]WLQ14013.1 primosomal protein N' [Hahella sp. HNIBRBA332]